ncbi:Calmodulin-regulated spectrin-associated protein 2 [Collichthys lucidus]|uniref:Calmodulin-regulated spectrin-associated protein 2 n=1 Tax=Collichthys lucidus TaxID=240159 RepID=A0A4U5UX67_COLLU|nr:Calmodulin-regulated spectrin-associated protein 2 [Collichthys lucidus]
MGDATDDRGMRRTFIVPAIKSFDHYDFTRAKISCSLTWLVAKAFGSDAVPEELAEPLYRDQYNQEHLKPPVACLLQSAELYCRAGSLILRSDAVKPLLGHNAVIQALAQKGLYVTDQDRLVTERDLTSTPIHMSSHLALIDTLMMAYTVEMVSVERVMSCINRYSSAEPSHSDGHIQELPYDTEDAIITWINKVNEHLRDILVEEQKLREASFQETNATTQKARYRKEHAQQRNAPSLPLVENLLKDNTDGCALTTLLHFYCSQAVRLEDICLKETMSLADSLYNLQLVQEFCRNNLNHCCHFSLEDMLYAHASIKSNYLVFMAELFWWFEVVKPSFVQPRVFNPNACEPVSSCRNMAPVSSPVKQSYADRPHSPESIPAEGIMRRSTSMSYVDGCVGTWPKEKRSSPRGISFEIPLDGDPPSEAPSLRGMTRSASSDGLGFKVHFASRGGIKRHLSLLPNVNGQSRHIPEEDEDFPSHKPLGRNNTFSVKNQSRPVPRYSNGVLSDSNHSADDHHGDHSGHISPTTPPSIEEALKIIHDSERPHASLGVGDGDNGFFLHGAEPSDPPGAQGQGDDPGSAKADPNSLSTDEVDTGIHVRTEDIQSLDEDSSSLRDYSDIDPDCEAMTRCCTLSERSERDRSREAGQKGVGDASSEGERGDGGDRSSPCPSSAPTLPRSHTASPASSSGGSGGMVRMTSFAEQKFRKLEGRSSGGTTPESSDLNVPYTHPPKNISSQISTPPLPITSPSPVTPSPRDPSHLIASEMIQLRMKLEEKRRAIEAQKKKVEAAFTRHRQKMGRTAFLNVVRRKGVTAPLSPGAGGAETPSPEPLTSSKETSQGSMERAERCKPDGAAPKSPCEDGGGVTPGEIDLADYTRSIERLNTSLGFLQTEMQRLAQQQEKIMAMRDQQQQAWVIPPPAPSPHRQLRELRSSSVTGRGSGRGSVGSLSPILSSSGSPHAPNRSPAGIKRRPASFHARTPRTPRPNDLKVTPFSRMLNTPTSVDSLPRLRRFTSSQSQLSPFAYLGHNEGPEGSKNQEDKDNKENTKDKEETMESAGTTQPSTKEAAKKKEDERQADKKQTEQTQSKDEVKQTRSSEVLCQPVSDIQGPAGSQVKADPQDRRELVELPLSRLKPPGGSSGQEVAGKGEVDREAGGDTLGDDQKMCCGFFFKDDVKGEEDMAAKKAALLEKRLRREKETQERKQQQELDQERKKEAARLKAEEEQLKKDDEKARREYIRNEYLRKQQLKLMVDMDEVIKPRSGSLKKKPRPKSIHRDVMESSTPTVRATGVRPRGFSVSSVSLASLNLADNDRDQPNNRKNNRPDSAEGFSSCPSTGSRNGEKDWENDSTTSSTPSNAEYTGPKLYKEPSAKSNKHIIQNALAHCCLAGKVNEGQKNKILDEMEKSEANSFLILFRDAGCQFRSVYTYCPETEEITKLAGIGPRSITTKMIEGLYKYNSDRKQFSQIPAKTMSASVDAITIASHLWQTKKQGTPKKLHPK